MTLPCASGPHIFLSSSGDISVAQSLSLLITTVKASKATGTSMNEIPASSHFLISFAFTGRDAPEIEVSPRQNFLKPPPVPETPTVTFLPVSF